MSDDDYSSNSSISRASSVASLALSPHPEEENIAPQGKISNANAGLDAIKSNGIRKQGNENAIPRTPLGSATKRRRLGSPSASISVDGAHATPPSAIGGGLMPSSPVKKQINGHSSTKPAVAAAVAAKQKPGAKKDAAKGEGWEEVLQRLGTTTGGTSIVAIRPFRRADASTSQATRSKYGDGRS